MNTHYCSLLPTIALLLLSAPAFALSGEDAENKAFCDAIGGRTEVRHAYYGPTGRGSVLVDCETADAVYEGGLDKRSSLDSVQQALFFRYMTGKRPAVVIYDTDGKMGPYEHRIRIACKEAGILFRRVLATTFNDR